MIITSIPGSRFSLAILAPSSRPSSNPPRDIVFLIGLIQSA